MKDLVVLVADIDAENALKGLFSRVQAIGIRTIECDIFRHPQRDPGCRIDSCDFLRRFANQYQHALVVFDHEGCGHENKPRADIEQEIEEHLGASGWNDRATVVVIAPELEIWVWSDSRQVDTALGWNNHIPDLRSWLRDQAFLLPNLSKPERPKEAMQASLRAVRKGYSASIFRQIAQSVSINRCTDLSFNKLLSKLRLWFGAS